MSSVRCMGCRIAKKVRSKRDDSCIDPILAWPLSLLKRLFEMASKPSTFECSCVYFTCVFFIFYCALPIKYIYAACNCEFAVHCEKRLNSSTPTVNFKSLPLHSVKVNSQPIAFILELVKGLAPLPRNLKSKTWTQTKR